jgi:hypothetical protein
MTEKNDWRLTNQENYLMNKELIYGIYKPYSKTWNHDHCTFCSDTFSEHISDLHEGYCTPDHYHWICENCFNDFKEMFNWTVIEK